MPQSIKTAAYTLVLWQIGVVVGLAFIFTLSLSLRSGWSFLLGGLAYCGPNLLFVWRVFAHTQAQHAKRFLASFVSGEVLKLFLSAVLFVSIVTHMAVTFKFVLAGYISAIFAFWVVSFIFLVQDHPPEGL